MEVISNINNHDFQVIKCNKYEQGNQYIVHNKVSKNKFFSIPTIMKKDVGISVPTLYAQLVPIIENKYIVDLDDYTLKFKKVINNEILKTITNRYNVLKKDLFSFIEEKTYKIPSNNDVMKMFCNLCKCNFVVLSVEKKNTFQVFSFNDFDKTYVLSQNSQNTYDTLELAISSLRERNFFEIQNFEKMKLSELMEYAKKSNIHLKGYKKKQDVLNEITKKLI